MESLITTPPAYFSNSGGGGGYLEDVLQQLHYNIPNSSYTNTTNNLLLYHPPLHLDSTSLLNTHINSNALSTSTSESSSSTISRCRRSSVDQESMIFPTPKVSNYYSPPLEDHAFSTSLLKDIHIMYSPKCDHDQLQKSSLFSITCQENNNELERMKQKVRSTTKRRRRRLVYHPFALVKPGGEEGDVTLNDINTRMLMPPTRPIPHPVGHFASRPSSHRPNGKPILALTTIRTLGTGTLTIITT